ncbi:unnamed protein product [Enterobius vermicularis]|uniref:Uncharacterized protein n=1 Tax=Enterobius vermicularis TaxID=51028 RepID=A0A0N4V6K8_ENTVE|nr:unnamed protein product [Enterobius vermicularis]
MNHQLNDDNDDQDDDDKDNDVDDYAEEFGIRREETPNIALTSLLLITFPQQNPTVMTANNCHYFHVPKS